MKKFLLTLAAAFIATFAMAAEYPVVTSVEELKSHPDNTMVLFENLQVSVVETDMGSWVDKNYYLSDLETAVGGNVYPIPAGFSAVGYLHTASRWDGSTYREFFVHHLTELQSFETLADLINFTTNSDYYDVLVASENVIAKSGTFIVTHVYNDYIFGYTVLSGGYAQQLYAVMTYPNASEEVFPGYELEGYVDGGVFKGHFVPTYREYDKNNELVSHKGGCYTLSEDNITWPENFGLSIPYTPSSIQDLVKNWVSEAQPIRIPGGGVFTQEDDRYYYVASYMSESYDAELGWVNTEVEAKIEVASGSIDLSELVGTTCEDYVAGVWDFCNTGDTDRILITEFISSVAEYDDIASFLAKGEQYEDQIITQFNVPLLVTYKIDDEKRKFVLTVTDGANSVALDYSDAIDFDDEGNPTAEYAALRAIQPGDMVSGVKGYPQFYASSRAPQIACALYDWNTEKTVVYVPTVESSGNDVNAIRNVTVGDMLAEWADCQNNNTVARIANNVVSLLDVEVVSAKNMWDEDVLYLVQGTDSMELSNLWGADKMNFQTYERNNIVGIADYCIINSNYIYQFQPLSQEHITDASLITEVENIEDLVNYIGTPVILRNAEIKAISDGRFTEFFLQDEETYVQGLQICGKYDLKGTYDGEAFTVASVEKVHGFNAISDMDMYTQQFPETAGEAYNVFGNVTVTYADGENVFVQYMATNAWGGQMMAGNVLLGVKTQVEAGDIITGLKGVSSPKVESYDEDWNTILESGARFTVAEDANITVVSSDNEVQYGQGSDLPFILGNNAAYYSGQAMKIYGGGTFVKEGDKYYYKVTAVDEKDGTVTEAQVEALSNIVDLDAYLDAPIANDQVLLVVYDAGNTTNEARRILVTGFMSTLLEYQNIAELIEAGELTDYSLTAAVVNPVTVTYVHSGGMGNFIFIQDETGALRLNFEEETSISNYKVGDQLAGVKGKTSYSWMGYYYLSASDNNWKDYTFEVTGTVTPTVKEATIPALNQEYNDAYNNAIPAVLYTHNLIELKEVSISTTTDGYGEEAKCLVDAEGNTLIVPNNFAEGLTTYEKMNIRGIADFGSMNFNGILTIHPRSQEDINDALGVNGVEVVGGIYLDAANQVVANGAVAVVVYDLNGRTVAAANAATVDADGLAQGVYVVRATYADGEVATAKVVR